MDIKFSTRIEVNIRPEGATSPIIHWGIDQVNSTPTVVSRPMKLAIDMDLTRGNHTFIIEFNNKTNDTPDMAVVIESVAVEGITTDRFAWAGIYYPTYPEPWASEQTDPLPDSHKSATYLGWNGRWELPFTTPIFTWIHQTENLGWIYS